MKIKDKTNCPIFINYHKEANISITTKYEDKFINSRTLQWMSKNKRTMESPDVQAIMNFREGLRLPLFINKHKGEGSEFYYLGDVEPIITRFEQVSMPDDDGKQVSVVKMEVNMLQPVEPSIYDYITSEY